MIHFELIFVKGIKSVFRIAFLHVDVQLFQTLCWKCYLSPLYCLCSFVKDWLCVQTPYVCGSISGLSVTFHWSICLFFQHYHAVLISVALQQVLKLSCVCPWLCSSSSMLAVLLQCWLFWVFCLLCINIRIILLI